MIFFFKQKTAYEIIRGLADGDSAVVRSHGEQLAVHRSDEGQLETVSAVCTHAGGIVLWNDSDSQWACACHGSKFSSVGSVLPGPTEEHSPFPNYLDVDGNATTMKSMNSLKRPHAFEDPAACSSYHIC